MSSFISRCSEAIVSVASKSVLAQVQELHVKLYAAIQEQLLRVLDWNFVMPPELEEYYCDQHSDLIAQMSENVTRNEFIYESAPNHGAMIQNIAAAFNNEASATDALTLAACMRDQVNPKGWMRGLFSSMTTGRQEIGRASCRERV